MNNLNIKKPRLVEKKLIELYSEHYKQKEVEGQFKAEETLRQEIENDPQKKFSHMVGGFKEGLWSFMKDNWGFVLILVLLSLLLLLRWHEVSKKKKDIKK